MRLFIQSNPALFEASIVRWVEVAIDEQLLTRIALINRLINEHQLFSVDVEIDVQWVLHEGWRLCGLNNQPFTLLSAWGHGFSLKTYVEPVVDSTAGKSVGSPVDVCYIWGDIDEFIQECRSRHGEQSLDLLETAQGLFESEVGAPDWTEAFAAQVAAHLQMTDQPPLKLLSY